jgi:hypothetical protein
MPLPIGLVGSAKTYWETMGRFAKVSRRKRLSNNISRQQGICEIRPLQFWRQSSSEVNRL